MGGLSGQALVDAVRPAYASTRCACGRSKTARKAFCRKCLGVLPRCVRAGLDRALIDGAAASYVDSLEWLEDEGYVRPGAAKGVKNLGLFGE